MNMKIKILVVSLFVAAFTLAGCNTVSAPSAPVSTDVTADVLTERKILNAIGSDPGLNATKIGVSCINGIVTLRGNVETALEKELAERIARNVSGVSDVQNLLQFQ